MRIKPANLILFVLVALAVPGAALAQRAGGGGPTMGPGSAAAAGSARNQPGNTSPTAGSNSSTAYKSITGTIVELDTTQNTLSVKNKKDGKVTAFTLVPKTKLKAEKKTDLADKKDLKLEDFKAGEMVEITFTGDGSVTELRLKYEKDKAQSADAQKSS
jgi:hypothetical protein